MKDQINTPQKSTKKKNLCLSVLSNSLPSFIFFFKFCAISCIENRFTYSNPNLFIIEKYSSDNRR